MVILCGSAAHKRKDGYRSSPEYITLGQHANQMPEPAIVIDRLCHLLRSNVKGERDE